MKLFIREMINYFLYTHIFQYGGEYFNRIKHYTVIMGQLIGKT